MFRIACIGAERHGSSDLYFCSVDFLAVGPLMSVTGLHVSDIKQTYPEWEELGDVVIKSLGYQKQNMNAAAK